MSNSNSTVPHIAEWQQELKIIGEESHYNGVLDDLVELIVLYGYERVATDLANKIGAKEW